MRVTSRSVGTIEISFMPERPSTRARQNLSWVQPIGDTTPIPVLTTHSSASAVGQKLVHGSSDLGDRVKCLTRRPVGVIVDCDPEFFFKGKDDLDDIE